MQFQTPTEMITLTAVDKYCNHSLLLLCLLFQRRYARACTGTDTSFLFRSASRRPSLPHVFQTFILSPFSRIYVNNKRKVRIRIILGFCCTNLGSKLWRNNPRIAHTNIGSEDLLRKPRIRGFAAQTSNPHAII